MSRRYSRFFSRRILYGAPTLIIFGIIYLFYDAKIGGVMLGVGVAISIALVIDIVRRRRRRTTQTGPMTYTGHQSSTIQQPIHYQPINTKEQDTQEQNSKLCSHCGSKNDTDTKFCTNCGANI